MAIITKEEVLKIAKMSRIAVHEDEIDSVKQHLQEVLTYAERVQEIAQQIEEPSNKNCNVFREDTVVSVPVEPIMDQAPVREGNFFVVPSILDK